jgi:hypothetical protein
VIKKAKANNGKHLSEMSWELWLSGRLRGHDERISLASFPVITRGLTADVTRKHNLNTILNHF